MLRPGIIGTTGDLMTVTGRRAVACLAAMAAAVMTGVVSPVGAVSASASDATFTQPGSIVVGDADPAPIPSSLEVGGVTGQVVDIDVTLIGVTHTFPSDLDVVLVAPDGMAATTLISDVGGDDETPATGSTLVFDDDAAGPPPAGLPSGHYLPFDDDTDTDAGDDPDIAGADGTLADLAATASPNGLWKLYVSDDSEGFDGSIGSWSLTFHVAAPPVVNSPAYWSWIASTTLPVRGTAAPGTRVYVWLDQQPTRSVVVAPDGSWATDFTGLTDGLHTVRGWNFPSPFGAPVLVIVRVDSTAPTGTLTLRTVNGGPELTSSRQVYLVVNASEPLRGIRVSNDGNALGPLTSGGSGVTSAGHGEVAWELGDHDGERRVFVQLEDMAGNVSGNLTDTVVLDRVAPRVIRTSPAAKASHVRRAAVISAHFNDVVMPKPAVRLSSLAHVFRVGSDKPIRATVRYDAASATVRVLPSQLLRRNTLYKVVVGGFHDAAGNYLDQDAAKAGTQQKVWRFRTR
jgi:subtilisin-like proprotein convertase family protein